MTIIYLIRHGLNDYVGKQKLAGWLPEVHLNERGLAQAEALGAYFSSIKLKAVYASPLERAMETAKPIAAARGLKVIPRAGLGEVKYGSWEGKSLKALRRRKLWPTIQVSPSVARFPGGESFMETQARIVSELERLRAKHRSPKSAIACVGHADTIKLAIAYHVGMPLDMFQRIVILPASISVLAIDDRGAHLFRLNDTRAAEAVEGE